MYYAPRIACLTRCMHPTPHCLSMAVSSPHPHLLFRLDSPYCAGGATWGESGYIRVQMTGSANGGIGQCGMYQEAFHAPSTFTKTLNGE